MIRKWVGLLYVQYSNLHFRMPEAFLTNRPIKAAGSCYNRNRTEMSIVFILAFLSITCIILVLCNNNNINSVKTKYVNMNMT